MPFGDGGAGAGPGNGGGRYEGGGMGMDVSPGDLGPGGREDESLGFWGGLGQALSESVEGMFSVPDFSSKINTALALGDPAMLDRAIAEAELAGTNLTTSEAQAMTGGIRSQEDSQTGRTSELASETLRELPFTERLKYAHDYYSSAIPGIARFGISTTPLDSTISGALAAAALGSALTGNLANLDVSSPDISNTAQGGDPVFPSTQETLNNMIGNLVNNTQPNQVGGVLSGLLNTQGSAPSQTSQFRPLQQRQIRRVVPGTVLGGM